MYVHAGVLHLGMNMGGLYRLGYDLEKEFGWKRISVIYFLSGLV
jgi:membrane associated rhomboid family serine protease